jgi:hypothetical protein
MNPPTLRTLFLRVLLAFLFGVAAFGRGYFLGYRAGQHSVLDKPTSMPAGRTLP